MNLPFHNSFQAGKTNYGAEIYDFKNNRVKLAMKKNESRQKSSIVA